MPAGRNPTLADTTFCPSDRLGPGLGCTAVGPTAAMRCGSALLECGMVR